MAQFFKAKPKSSKFTSKKIQLQVSQLDYMGAGIAYYEGKVVFVPQALPDEVVTVQLIEQKANYAKAKLISIDKAASHRIKPLCEHYQNCGGCDLQHLDIANQRQTKIDLLTQRLTRSCQQSLTPEPSIVGEPWNYRRRARLATWYDVKSNSLSLGFRQESSKQVVNIDQCPVLAKELACLIKPLRELLNQLRVKTSLGHVELIDIDSGRYVVLRLTKSINDTDKQALAQFASSQQISLLLQDNDGHFTGINGAFTQAYYLIEGMKLAFSPGNFIQVNGPINQQMIHQAITWLAPKAGERILDLFCGIGNFSLALAAKGAEVVGVEGVEQMVSQAKDNAQNAGLPHVKFYHADLSADLSKMPWLGKIDKLLLDPARAGAYETLAWLPRMKPKLVLYVACDPASLARDSQRLLKQGYQLHRFSLIDMFPQTHHIEAMALFIATK